MLKGFRAFSLSAGIRLFRPISKGHGHNLGTVNEREKTIVSDGDTERSVISHNMSRSSAMAIITTWFRFSPPPVSLSGQKLFFHELKFFPSELNFES